MDALENDNWLKMRLEWKNQSIFAAVVTVIPTVVIYKGSLFIVLIK